MKTLFLFVPNYVYSGDLLRTPFIGALKERFRVFVLLPMASDSYPQHPDVTYVPWKLNFPAFWNFWGKTVRVPLIRMFDHEPLVQRNYQLSFGHWKRKLLRRAASLFPRYFWNPDFISRLEARFLPPCPRFRDLLKQHRPVLVVTPTPGFTDLDAEAILLARRDGIPTVAMDFSWDNLTSNCKHLRRTVYLIAWTEAMKRQAVALHGYPPERVSVSGIMRFDHYFRETQGEKSREEFLRQKGLDPRRKTILITTVTRGNYKDEPEIIRQLLAEREKGMFGEFVNFFIRLHPKEDNIEDYREFKNLPQVRVERAGTEQPKVSGQRIELNETDLVNLKDTLRYADAVVNYASTITLEACVFDKPVVNIGFPPYYMNAYSFTHYKPVVELGAVRIAKSFNELVREVKTYLLDPSRDRENRAAAVREFIGFTDGKSYERVMKCIEKIAE